MPLTQDYIQIVIQKYETDKHRTKSFEQDKRDESFPRFREILCACYVIICKCPSRPDFVCFSLNFFFSLYFRILSMCA